VCQDQPDHFRSELLFITGQLRVALSRLEALQAKQKADGKIQTSKALERSVESLEFLVQDARLLLAEIGEP
jgi:hypothetical protein